MGYQLGRHLGCKDPAHLARWLAALTAGKNRLPRCTAVTRLGKPCRSHAMIGTDRCQWHLTGAARVKFNETRIARLERLARLSDIGLRGRSKARAGLRNIQRFKLMQIWKVDPSVPGEVFELDPEAEQRVRAALLADFDIDLDAELEETGRVPSPRLCYRLRRAVALLLGEKISRHAAQRRIDQALRAEVKFFRSLARRVSLVNLGRGP